MLFGLTPSAESFLTDIDRLQKRFDRAERQLTSGFKLTRVSDGPDDVSRLLTARASLERAEQTELNLGRVKTEVDTAESSLGSAASLMDRARTLAAQGANGNQTAATRSHIASELQGILERLVSVANVSVEGRYLFSGDADQVAAYTLDDTQPSGVAAYQGTVATRQVADSTGLTFSVALTADVIFDSANPDEKIFEAVNGMRRALLAVDNPPTVPDPTIPTIDQALHNLGQSALYLNQQIATYGIYQNRVTDATDAANRLQLSLKQQVSSVEEADLAEAATELAESRTALEAAFTARSLNPRRSLFDYLG